MAKAATWSTYKHHNTVKYLISITPQGTVSFISKGYGGRVSDKYITENCGYLYKLQPGDVVLADRGFNVQESVAYRGATLYQCLPKPNYLQWMWRKHTNWAKCGSTLNV